MVVGIATFKYFEGGKYFLSLWEKVLPPNGPVYSSSDLGSSFEESLYSELKNTINVTAIQKLDNNTYTVRSDEGLTVLFSPTKSLSNQINSLQTILTHSRIEKRLLGRVDLRFSKVAIEYKR